MVIGILCTYSAARKALLNRTRLTPLPTNAPRFGAAIQPPKPPADMIARTVVLHLRKTS